jgi:hypothetical protein
MVLPITKPQNRRQNLRLCTSSNPFFTQKTTTSSVGGCTFVRISGKFDYPIIYTDPDGNAFHVLVAALGAAAGGAVAAVISIQAGSNIKDTLINVGIGAIGGAAAGLVMTSTANAAFSGALISASSNLIIQRTTGSGKVDPLQVAIASLIGAAASSGGTVMGNGVSKTLTSSGVVSAVTATEIGAVFNTVTTTMAAGLSGAITALMDFNK